MSRSTRFWIACAIAGVALLNVVSGCASAPQLPFYGFADKATLDQKDTYVMHESVGGALDPNNLAAEGIQYTHDHIAYNRVEEGYYQWGHKLYEMGYRDGWYIRDMAPKAFQHELLDTYDHAIKQGFEDAMEQDPAGKK
jgi:hypothetical protein